MPSLETRSRRKTCAVRSFVYSFGADTYLFHYNIAPNLLLHTCLEMAQAQDISPQAQFPLVRPYLLALFMSSIHFIQFTFVEMNNEFVLEMVGNELLRDNVRAISTWSLNYFIVCRLSLFRPLQLFQPMLSNIRLSRTLLRPVSHF